MNPKQFFNNSICFIIDKFKIKYLLKYIALLLYPDYLLFPKNNWFKSKNIFFEIIKLYIFLFIILFLAQAFGAYLNNSLFPDNNPFTINFFEDSENLLNYLLVCQVYVILGYFFLKSDSDLNDKLLKNGFFDFLNIKKIEYKSPFGFIGLILLFILTIYFSAGYAYDITNYSDHLYWFMKSGPPNVTYTKLGYYYFFINFILLFFVLLVGFSFVGFIKKVGYISSIIDNIIKSNTPIDSNWENENKIKYWLSPISKQVFLIQLMVIVLTLNIFLWNVNKQGVNGINYPVTVFALILFGVWLFTLPRYYINYKIFQIWQKIGKREYKNLNLPWIIGASSFLDLILFTILLKSILGESWSDLISKFFEY